MVSMGGTGIIPGALTAYYDGHATTEAGYLHRGPTPIVTAVAGGGLPAATTYYFMAVLYYADRAGRIHWSAPSRFVSAATAGANLQFSITVPYCKQTLRGIAPTANFSGGTVGISGSGLTPVQIKIYRSAGNPGSLTNNSSITMYPITAISLMNTPDDLTAPTPLLTDYFTPAVTDGTLDATLTTGVTLYTNGQSAFASIGTYAPPPFDCLTVWNNRAWGVSNRNGPELWFSWPLSNDVIQAEGPAWSVANRIPIPAEIGQPKAIVGLDDKLLILRGRPQHPHDAGASAYAGRYPRPERHYTPPYGHPLPGSPGLYPARPQPDVQGVR
jgi:hypothetical protein